MTFLSDLEIVADLGSRVVEFDYRGDHYIRTEHYFLMRIRSDRQRPRNAKDSAQFNVRWIPTADAITALTFPAEQDALRRALAELAKDDRATTH